jgi:hypothetical protein
MTSRTGAMLGILLGLLLMTAASQGAFLNPSPDAPTSSVHPRLNMGPGGHIFLVWEKERGDQSYDIYFTPQLASLRLSGLRGDRAKSSGDGGLGPHRPWARLGKDHRLHVVRPARLPEGMTPIIEMHQ